MKTLTTFLTVLLFAVSLKSQAQITTYPYVATGDNISGWSVNQTGNLWYLGFAGVNPTGAVNNLAIVCNFYNFPSVTGPTGMIISPVLDMSSLTKPVLNFYVAYRTHTAQNDSLIVMISTNGGSTFTNTPVPYKKAFNSTPSLATISPNTNQYVPSAASQWRLETIDLSAYAGMNNVKIAFKGRNANGNDLWIDDFIVSDADVYCSNTFTSPGSYTCNGLLRVNMSSVGLLSNNVSESDQLNSGNERLISSSEKIFLPNSKSTNVILNNQTDNPAGGVLSVTQRNNETPPSQSSPVINVNTTAVNPGSTITNPNVIYQDYWFTVSYTGNDYLGNATYNLAIDVTYFTNRSNLYIIQRADQTGPWTCLNTSVSLDEVFTTGLTSFGDFALAGDSVTQPLPVELSSFVSVINNNDVTLNWSTVSEINNSGFDVERSSVQNGSGQWSKVGSVSGNGTTDITNYYSFTDKALNSGRYSYRLKQIDFNGNFEYFNLSNEVNIGIPVKFSLSQNYPNPFNPSTKINYEMAFDGNVSLKIFDISGKEVASVVNDYRPAGFYTVNFNGSSLSSGMYFYRISVDGNGNNYSAVKKMILVK
ncbi:MAG TPA: T9SS type A sorting domain-containing protein [Ignavibacteria bacterium]|nr:T9SS type A sorting domain-containing protein [Ignavibacteria bacterium]